MTLWFICQAPWWCQRRGLEPIQMSSRGLSSVKRESVLPLIHPNPRCVFWLCWPITEAVCSADHAGSQHALTDACVLSLMQECILTALIQVFEWQLWVLVKHFGCRFMILSVCSGPHPDSWSNKARSLYIPIHVVSTLFHVTTTYLVWGPAREVCCLLYNSNGRSSRG